MDLVSDYVRLPSSEVRLEILLSLNEAPKTLSELKSETSRRNTTILHALNDLSEINIVTQEEKKYKLTTIGILESTQLKNSVDMAETLQKFQNFWLMHNISEIPKKYLLQIGVLKNAALIKAEDTHIGKVHERYLDLMKSSKYVKGISPVFHPDFLNLYQSLLNEGTEIELILTNDIIEEILSQIDVSELSRFILNKQLTIFQKEKLPVALTVTDKVISLGLFSINGNYDYNVDLIDSYPKARAWGEGLYEYYRKGSKNLSEEIGMLL
jgi:predicted transcriptional regulator